MILSNLPYLPTLFDTQQQVPRLAHHLRAHKGEVTLLKGPAGIGKTSLALHAAHKISQTDAELDYTYHITARATPWTTNSDVIDPFSRFLGLDRISALEDGDTKIQEFRQQISGMNGLIILDNVETVNPAIVESIATLGNKITVLCTSRSSLDIGRIAVPFEVRRQPLEDSISLVLASAAAGSVLEVALRESRLMKLIGGNPLAAKWVGGRLRDGIPLRSLEQRLSSGEGDLFSKLFADNWHEIDTIERTALIVAAHMGPTVSFTLLAQSTPAEVSAAEDAVAELVRRSLLEISRAGTEAARVNIHPLARSYAVMRYEAEPEGEQRRIKGRLVSALTNFLTDRIHLQRGREGYDEIDEEVESITLVLDEAISRPGSAGNESARETIELADALSVYLWRRGRWTDRVRYSESAANLAATEGQNVLAARAFCSAGIVRHWQGRPIEARKFAERAQQALIRKPHRAIDTALVNRLFALIEHSEGNSGSALIRMLTVLDSIRETRTEDDDSRKALRLFSDWPCSGPFGYRSGEVAILQEIGIIYTDLGTRAEAEHWLGRSIAVADQIGDEEGKAIALSHRGRSNASHDPRSAAADFSAALRLARHVGRRSTEGRSLLGLAQTGEYNDQDRRNFASNALSIFERLGMQVERDSCAVLINTL